MSGSIQNPDDDNAPLYFKKPLSLAELQQCMKHFEHMFFMVMGVPAKYDDFTDWLVHVGAVDVGISKKQINEIMAGGGDHAKSE